MNNDSCFDSAVPPLVSAVSINMAQTTFKADGGGEKKSCCARAQISCAELPFSAPPPPSPPHPPPPYSAITNHLGWNFLRTPALNGRSAIRPSTL